MPDDPKAARKTARKTRKAASKKSEAKRAKRRSQAPDQGPPSPVGPPQRAYELTAYGVDLMQRQVLFFDTLRQRANNMLSHEKAGMPPVLAFKYELVADAASFEPASNYQLLKILEVGDICLDDCLDPDKPPVIIIDPRAGHGPGIGGFKADSEVGIALHEGYPVYFVVFTPDPMPGQTLPDVIAGLRQFVDLISEQHDGRAPVLYGNCQGGWAAALLAADCEGLAGPVVMNGSPLSYWAGEPGANPMRLAAGFLGGAWINHLLADLGNGRFDGAWLVQNFENLKPEGAIFRKYADLFENIDTASDRFLEFERWWGGYYRLSREEILAIVENLFIGNQLEQGRVKLGPDCEIDLKQISNPLVIFASHGDNITPPHQALGWIPAVYKTTEDLIAADQHIVYMINQHAGHLGIFVSASVARLEHRAILEHLPDIDALEPGLYEMRIDNPTGDPDCDHDQYSVRFEPRRVEDLVFNTQPEAFERVSQRSARLEAAYSAFASPLVRAWSNPVTAEMMKWSHPMRVTRYIFSERLNPAMAMTAALAPMVRANRKATGEDNRFRKAEKTGVDWAETGLTRMRESRDAASEQIFSWLFDWPSVPGVANNRGDT
ncbi:MAG TPA: poly(3-hydroxyalkanoate) synthetase [Hyphomonas sp.]|uniref:DUF3141 domain-containing protein n=1 Tax=uncultured Hyphomonas sp. TaxID=225298 RepID=UPI000C516ABA|nr:poly(3-hydroxyalkanoate) synthetase [Hyphomonas sp.]MAN91632.1 poly(3-hydroxyalkanoate) synthetase [Hyphomonadaceae bacterium]HBL93784.1 poly(3-hydroxyalkanoate) synthetase [Hyphomonas sp.]HCJ18796.1 poly(3-hydroxyalkanoate) synthetase [Hyphomonas sp.]|tara:strand:- start:48481 stop:50298 length:1818 start_codon:yes stop_codon:yes gene_type:complete